MKRKDLGQHFLIDNNVIQDEIRFADLNINDVVLEIGPGKGALTIPMSKKVKQVIAIEKDKSLYDQLLPIVANNVKLICADALKVDFSELFNVTKIVSNLPYKISSPITFKLLSNDFEKAILIYQKEFADRMVAKPYTKNYCRLSVGIYYHAFSRILRIVPRNCFSPQPKIESCIVELIPRKKPAFKVKDKQLFFQLTKDLFNHRRKKIKTIIKNKYNIETEIPFSDSRVEMLSPLEIGTISDLISDFQDD